MLKGIADAVASVAAALAVAASSAFGLLRAGPLVVDRADVRDAPLLALDAFGAGLLGGVLRMRWSGKPYTS